MMSHRWMKWIGLSLCLVLFAACDDDNDTKTKLDGGSKDAKVTDSSKSGDSSKPEGDGSAGEDATNAQDPEVGKTFKGTVKAATGGKLATESGKATLDVPGGALAKDTELTLTVEAASNTASSIYNFGPEGTSFMKPATLTLSFSGTVPKDKKAVLATYEDNKWVEITGAELKDGKVSGSVNHFSKFSVIYVDGNTLLVSACEKEIQDFKACGGSIEGTWEVTDFCLPTTSLGQNPFAKCQNAKFTVDMDWLGAVYTITKTSFTQTPYTFVTTTNLVVPKSCIGNGQNVDCKTIQGENNQNYNTCVDETDKCNCTKKATEQKPGSSGNYTIDGNNIVVGTMKVPYCVNGDKFVEEIPAGTLGKQYIVFTRKK
jgi:hypothetical protein